MFKYLVSNVVVNCADDEITESPLGLNTEPLITPSPLVFKYLVSKVLVNCAEDDITESPFVFKYLVSKAVVSCAEEDTSPLPSVICSEPLTNPLGTFVKLL